MLTEQGEVPATRAEKGAGQTRLQAPSSRGLQGWCIFGRARLSVLFPQSSKSPPAKVLPAHSVSRRLRVLVSEPFPGPRPAKVQHPTKDLPAPGGPCSFLQPRLNVDSQKPRRALEAEVFLFLLLSTLRTPSSSNPSNGTSLPALSGLLADWGRRSGSPAPTGGRGWTISNNTAHPSFDAQAGATPWMGLGHWEQ